MTLFRATAASSDRPLPSASATMPPSERRTDRSDGAIAAAPGGVAVAAPAQPWPGLALRPTVLELVEQMTRLLAAGLAAMGLAAEPEDTAPLARQLHERIMARIASCRDAVISGRLGGLQQDQRARLRAIAPAPGQLVERMTPELDQATLLALLNEPMQGLADTTTGHLASQIGRLQPALAEAALDALYGPLALDRFDHSCRMHYARAFAHELPQLALPEDALEAACGALALEDGEQSTPPPQHREASEALLLEALRRGDNQGAIQVLAAAALVPVTSVEAAITLRSRRGMVSLAWKAGYSMRAATLIQSQLAGIPPDRALVATADGSCPLSRREILWQIGFLARRLG